MGSRPRVTYDPFALWMLGADMTRLAIETQTVIGLRLLGMAGLWSVTPFENRRMVAEKGKAFAKAGLAMANAAAAGKTPDAVLSAGIAPLGAVTSANVRRLSRRGPRAPGGTGANGGTKPGGGPKGSGGATSPGASRTRRRKG